MGEISTIDLDIAEQALCAHRADLSGALLLGRRITVLSRHRLGKIQSEPDDLHTASS